MKMTKKTAKRLTQALIKEIESHPHRDELISLAIAQLMDDET
jgi:hypothetical protein